MYIYIYQYKNDYFINIHNFVNISAMVYESVLYGIVYNGLWTCVVLWMIVDNWGIILKRV